MLLTNSDLKRIDRSHQYRTALFSIIEHQGYYLLAVDLPSLHVSHPRIFRFRNSLRVEQDVANPEVHESIFRMLLKDAKFRSIYKNGVLWVLLPKEHPPEFQDSHHANTAPIFPAAL